MKPLFKISVGIVLALSIVGFTIQEKSLDRNFKTKVQCDTSVVYFKEQIMPLIQAKCVSCHNVLKAKADVMLDNFDNIKKTIRVKNNSGIIKNELESVLRTNFMPPGKHEKLTEIEKKLVYKWIQQGMQNNSCAESVPKTATIANADISFENTIKPILENNCVGCHNKANSDGGFDLTNVETVQSIAFNGLLIKTVNHSEGVRAMPLNAEKLPENTIQKIEIWINNGLK
jgi:hypothetical protein